MDYGYRKEVSRPFREVIEKTKEALAAEGFGVLTEIDIKATLKKKIYVEYDEYTILGACNPPLAHQALEAEKEIGLLLPCNVIVYKKSNTVIVSALLPSIGMKMVENEALQDIAVAVEAKIKAAVDAVN